MLGRSRKRFSVRPLEEQGRDREAIVDHGLALQQQPVLDHEHRLASAQAQHLGGLLVGALALEGEELDRGRGPRAVVALDVEELEQEAIGVVGGDEGAETLAPHQDVLGDELVGGAPRVPIETPKAAASPASAGRVRPGGQAPSSMARSSARLTAR